MSKKLRIINVIFFLTTFFIAIRKPILIKIFSRGTNKNWGFDILLLSIHSKQDVNEEEPIKTVEELKMTVVPLH